jgi:hypothetical protein
MSQRTARLLGVALVEVAVLLAIYDAYWLVRVPLENPYHNDFIFYYAAAKIGVAHGWDRIYDLELQRAQFESMTNNLTVGVLARYINPPPLAWLVLPFTLLSFRTAFVAWTLFNLLAFVMTWWLAAPSAGRVKVVHLLAAFGLLPVVYGLQLGQPTTLIVAGVAASCWLLVNKRPWLAGVPLVVIVFKPQVAWLVPVALLVAGRWRTVAGWALASAPVGILILLSLGLRGVEDYVALIAYASGVTYNQALTIGNVFGHGPQSMTIEVVLGGLATVAAWRLRRGGPELVLAAGLLGSILAAPYLHLGDLLVLVVAAWFFLRRPVPLWAKLWLLAGAAAAEFAAISSPIPLFVAELGFLVILLLPQTVTEAEPQGRPAPLSSAPSV